jgi:hypothetical protein
VTIDNGGTVTIASNIGTSPLQINDSATGVNLLDVKDLSTNFGSAVTAGAFISRNSYWGEEFNNSHLTGCSTTAALSAGTVNAYARGDTGGNLNSAVACASTATTTINAGELNVADVIGTATIANNQCNISSQNAANGIERIQAIITTGAAGGKAACAENLAANQTTSNKIYTTTNLPVITAKVKVQAMTVNATNSVVVVGANIRDNPGTDGAGVNLPNTGVFFTNCSTYTAGVPSGCSNTNWYGMVANGNALATGAQTCSVGAGSITSNFSYLRIEVRGISDIHFYADYNTSDGIVESECGTGVTAASSTSAMTPWLEVKAIGNNVLTNTMDVDYFRSWQDDNVAPTDPPADNPNTPLNESNPLTTAPITPDPDSPDPNTEGSFFDFNGATSSDTVFDHNVFVHGTLYADKIKANEIEGLSIFTDEISSLQAKLAAQSSSGASGSYVVKIGDATFNSVVVNMDLKVLGNILANGGLTVNGDANFLANVSLAGHIITSGNTPYIVIEDGAGLLVAPADNPAANLATASVDGNDISGKVTIDLGDSSATGKLITLNFKHAYARAPKVVITPANAASAGLQYYVQSTATGFTIVITSGQLTPASSLTFNYFITQ